MVEYSTSGLKDVEIEGFNPELCYCKAALGRGASLSFPSVHFVKNP
jgi:hypothetical protein